MKYIKETCYKGTKISIGNEKRKLINFMVDKLIAFGFNEINIPIIQNRETFKDKVGIENTSMMFSVKDNSNRDLVLAPEYTAVIQQLSKTTLKHQNDVKLFYIQECFRGEKPQKGRYRQFTQLGVEIINPKKYNIKNLINLCQSLLVDFNIEINENTTRGLDYYKNGKGFEIYCNELGNSKQICGGGEYNGGIGFAIGIDRLMLLIN